MDKIEADYVGTIGKMKAALIRATEKQLELAHEIERLQVENDKLRRAQGKAGKGKRQ
jgi:hypothetical protein